jgi:Cu/Zn superoxide dismutase
MIANKMRASILAGVMGLWLAMISTAHAQERAHAEIKNANGKTVGTVALRQTKEGVTILIQVTDLPQGLHAVHVHSTGKCEAPAFTSAGGHFNPQNLKHGLKNPEGPHAGDLPDLYVNKDGVGRYGVLIQNVTLDTGKLSILDADGKSIVIHATADDNMSDPAGNSGDRIACGAIAHGPLKK